mmetsp:Transcript_27886/g.32800  ORF Transcript_27886/g.32800 Transcript_27886/m.32800 type:complete len:98 (+) Transcript_27886:258-551(+)
MAFLIGFLALTITALRVYFNAIALGLARREQPLPELPVKELRVRNGVEGTICFLALAIICLDAYLLIKIGKKLPAAKREPGVTNPRSRKDREEEYIK